MRTILFSLLLISTAISAQTKLPVMIPASPEVSSLLNDVSFSTGLHTGASQTSFSFHTIKLGSFQLSISADYSTNGIRVDDIPSRVGLGWTLNAGGYVSRTVRDEPDGSSTFLYPPANLWDKNQALFDYLNMASADGYDTEWDEYSYSFNGYSGKFYVDDNGNGVPVPFNNLRIKVFGHNQPSQHVEITTPDGVRFEFGYSTTEKTRQITYQTDGSYGFATKNHITETAWFLDRIVTAENQIISLFYTKIMANYVTENFQQMVKPFFISTICDGVPCSSSVTTGTEFTKYDTYFVSSITSPADVVHFYYEDRPDNSGDVRLKTLTVRQAQAIAAHKLFRFDYYTPTMNNNTINKRFFLTAIRQKEAGSGDELDAGNFQTYSYDYFDINNMPDRLTFAQDGFGYNNGATNNAYFVPFIPSIANYVVMGNNGGNRSPSTIADIRKGALKTISFPTGGSKEFDYEQHTLYSTLTNGGTAPENKPVAGMRVKKIVTYDPVIKKRQAVFYTYASFADLQKSSAVGPTGAQHHNLERNGVVCYPGTLMAHVEMCHSYLVSSQRMFPVSLFGGSPYAYTHVIESDDSTFANGFTEHEFTTYIPGSTHVNWLGSSSALLTSNLVTVPNGLENRTRVYKKGTGSGFTLLKEEAHQYEMVAHTTSRKNFFLSKRWTYAGITSPLNNEMFDGFDLVEYRFESNWIRKASTTVRVFDENGNNPVEKSSFYRYDDISHQQVTHLRSTTSISGDTSISYFYYPTNFSLKAPPYNVYDTLLLQHRIATPVFQSHFVSGVLQKEQKTSYKSFANYIGIEKEYEKFLGNPFDSTLVVAAYDELGHVLEMKKGQDMPVSYIWSPMGDRVLAEVQNASKDDIAYTSFEGDGDGNWQIGSSIRHTTNAFTGSTSYALTNGPLQFSCSSAKTYRLGYWTTASTSLSIPGSTSVKTGPVLSTGWRYVEHILSGTATVQLSGSALIDEVRLYPAAAQIKTFTYTSAGLLATVGDAFHQTGNSPTMGTVAS